MSHEPDLTEGPIFNPGSFKDPEGRVFEYQGSIFRTMEGRAAERMKRLQLDGTIPDFVSRGLLIASETFDSEELGLNLSLVSKTIMRHARIPVITYPCEWSFDMMRDAALVTLKLLSLCLARGLILKDATSYNLACNQGHMQFFDTLSIDTYVPGTPWEGYAQFCREFLFPLMLTSYRGVEFQPLMKSSLKGVVVGDMTRLLTTRDKMRSAAFKHVFLQGHLDRAFSGTDREVRPKFKGGNFSVQMIEANIKSLYKTVERLAYRPKASVWGDYESCNSYNPKDHSVKEAFISGAIGQLKPRKIVDLGGNTGTYSLLVAKMVEQIICLDVDPLAINTLYGRLKEDNIQNVTPIVGNLLEPTPAMGWNLMERAGLIDRIQCEAFMALALVHHVCIGGNVPLSKLVDLLRVIAPSGVVEWVDRDDPMVLKMLRNRADVFDDYSWENFREEIEKRFFIKEVAETHGGNRRLCLLRPIE